MDAIEKGLGGLADSPFTYREIDADKIFISFRGQRVIVLKGAKALSFLQRVAGLDEAGQQLAMAKATGNFKRGNER